MSEEVLIEKSGWRITKYVVGPLSTNTYLLASTEGDALLIDPGPGAYAAVSKALSKQELKLKLILLTHGHFDHFLDAGPLKKVTNAEVLMHRADLPTVNLSKIAVNYFGLEWREPTVDTLLSGGEHLTAGSLKIKVIHTPGHTPGSVCYHLPELSLVFTGDTLFRGTVGRTDLPGGSSMELAKSLEKLAKLPEDTAVLPGHGPRTLIGTEIRVNPYLMRQTQK